MESLSKKDSFYLQDQDFLMNLYSSVRRITVSSELHHLSELLVQDAHSYVAPEVSVLREKISAWFSGFA